MLSQAWSRLPRLVAGLVVIWLLQLCASTSIAKDEVDYDQVIRPILSDRCYKCHGPDSETREADLRLDLVQDWSQQESGSSDLLIIKPGDSANSELFQRLVSDDEDAIMPPADSGLSLSESEKDAIQQWIDQGAKQAKHWSFVPIPTETVVPEIPKDFQDWPQNEIDHFVLTKQLSNGLTPNKSASNQRLVRRLFLDLTGLPPTPAEVQKWMAMPRQEMVSQLSQELMGRPAFGEHLAAQWLDAARYSDTYGYQVDRDRFVWPWRDWVVRSFNQNLPYDQFLTQQIAGDLLPDASADQILATTFCRLHPQKVEGGSVPEEFRVEYVSDRVQTYATAYLGLTMECCRCHDHKYDPVSQKNYFELSSFFDNIDEAGLYSYFTNSVPTPTLVLPDENKDQLTAELRAKVLQLQQDLANAADKVQPTAASIELNAIRAGLDAARIYSQDFEAENVIASTSENKIISRATKVGESKAIQLSGDEGYGLSVGNFRRWQPFTIALWMNTPDLKERAVVLHRSRAWTDAASRGYELLLEEGKLKFSLIHFWPGNAASVRMTNEFQLDTWHHVAISYDGSSQANGLRVYIDGKEQECETIRDQLTKQIAGGGNDNITLGERFRDRGFTDGKVDEVNVYNRQLSSLEIEHLWADANAELEKFHAELTTAEIRQYHVETSPLYQETLKRLQEARQQLFELQDGRQEIMVMRELQTPRQTFLLARGAYDAPTEPVDCATPEHVLEFPSELPENRLGLAQWTTDPQNPLTARVVVNRYWQRIFGVGLVRTPEDFGNQGAPPTHPLLLDFLARDLIENSWDVRRLIGKIVNSATYQQDSQVSPELRKRDPENLLLSRYPDGQRSAEVLRDTALAVSGLLNSQVGGPPVHPYDLSEAFSPTNFTAGEQQYRRSLYCYWKRTGPSPALIALDAAQRDVCQVKREKTQTPSQALVLLNAPQFVEAARSIALDTNDLPTLEQKIQFVYQRMLQRDASEEELTVLLSLYDDQLQAFANNPAAAENYLAVGQPKETEIKDPQALAALTAVVNTLFALDEFISRR